MEVPLRATIEAIHASPKQAVICLAGGAAQALAWLMCVPGASSTVLEVVVPYSRNSMTHLLRKIPTSFASQQASDDLANVAYNHALKLAMTGTPVVGIGFSGALATIPPKLGDHRFYVSARSSDQLWRSHMVLSKGLRDRQEEDAIASQLLIKGIAIACDVPVQLSCSFNHDERSVESEESFVEDEQLEQLLLGQICMKVYSFEKDTKLPITGRRIILSGSFNPLHKGHLKLMDVVCSLCKDALPCFELSAINADKPPLTIEEIKQRVKQFEELGKTVIVTNQPYFYKKAEILPNSSFILGVDTAIRLIDPKYYANDYGKMLEALLEMKQFGCNFYVGGRIINGTFKVISDFDIPNELKDMFVPIPEDMFRMDISSTELRSHYFSSSTS
eukprot:TRINITY_DN7052_c0_g1_i1.p1 TRINITY_DN7052_c0_g1~~TRINITY_DN7052_c0_g1_i1.p1  ORF type:complete len:389 (-),score=72.56 TRINITY_DN7052_c0_g1_i1:501-1667(-)